MGQKLNSYKDLLVWKLSHQIALEILVLSKKSKRTNVNFEIWKQLTRSSFSTPANIVEGFYTHKGKSYIAYLEIARASAGESDYWLLVLKEIGDINTEKYEELAGKYLEVIKMLSRIINLINAK